MKQISKEQIDEVINFINERRLIKAKEVLKNLKDVKYKIDKKGE